MKFDASWRFGHFSFLGAGLSFYFQLHLVVQTNIEGLEAKFALLLVSHQLFQVDLLIHSALGAIDVEGHLELHLLAVVLLGLAVVRDGGE